MQWVNVGVRPADQSLCVRMRVLTRGGCNDSKWMYVSLQKSQDERGRRAAGENPAPVRGTGRGVV